MQCIFYVSWFFFILIVCFLLIYLYFFVRKKSKRKCESPEACSYCKDKELCPIACQYNDLLLMTRFFKNHPIGYTGLCECEECCKKNK